MTHMWLYFVIGALAMVLAYLYWQEKQQTQDVKEGFYPVWRDGRWRRPGWWGGGWGRPGGWWGGWGPFYRPYPYTYPYYPFY